MRDRDKLSKIVMEFLCELGVDLGVGDLVNTPRRVAKTFLQLTRGYIELEPRLVTFPYDGPDQVIHIGGMEFSSLCEHHLLPFFGQVDIWYVPAEKIIGLSKPPRLIDHLSHRLMIQERFTNQILKRLVEVIEPKVLVVKVTAQHTCSRIRGVRSKDEYITTVATYFRDPTCEVKNKDLVYKYIKEERK